MSNSKKEKEKTPNFVVLAAKTPAGRLCLILSAVAMVITLVIVFLMDVPGNPIGEFFNRFRFALMLPGFLSMFSIERFSLIANAIRMDMENEKNNGR